MTTIDLEVRCAPSATPKARMATVPPVSVAATAPQLDVVEDSQPGAEPELELDAEGDRAERIQLATPHQVLNVAVGGSALWGTATLTLFVVVGLVVDAVILSVTAGVVFVGAMTLVATATMVVMNHFDHLEVVEVRGRSRQG